MFTALAIFIFFFATFAIGVVLGVAITPGAAKQYIQAVADRATPAIDVSRVHPDASLPAEAFERAA